MVSRSSIEEANKHIQALNGRISELDGIIKEQQNAMTAKDSFIQTKIQELMTQDRKIKDLSEGLNAANDEINNQDLKIMALRSDISAKDQQILNLQRQNDKMTGLLCLIPDLISVVEKIKLAHKEALGNSDTKLLETPSDGNSTADDGNTSTFITKDYHDTNYTAQQFSETARTLAKTERIQKFSISENDIDEDSINGSPYRKSLKKEFYL